MSGYPVEIGARRFNPIPESWLDHPRARDPDESEEARLFAVSATKHKENWIAIRYAHRLGKVWTAQVERGEIDSGIVPSGLERGTFWDRSVRAPGKNPDDVVRKPELDHFREIWIPRLDLEPDRTVLDRVDTRRAATDGGIEQ